MGRHRELVRLIRMIIGVFIFTNSMLVNISHGAPIPKSVGPVEIGMSLQEFRNAIGIKTEACLTKLSPEEYEAHTLRFGAGCPLAAMNDHNKKNTAAVMKDQLGTDEVTYVRGGMNLKGTSQRFRNLSALADDNSELAMTLLLVQAFAGLSEIPGMQALSPGLMSDPSFFGYFEAMFWNNQLALISIPYPVIGADFLVEKYGEADRVVNNITTQPCLRGPLQLSSDFGDYEANWFGENVMSTFKWRKDYDQQKLACDEGEFTVYILADMPMLQKYFEKIGMEKQESNATRKPEF